MSQVLSEHPNDFREVGLTIQEFARPVLEFAVSLDEFRDVCRGGEGREGLFFAEFADYTIGESVDVNWVWKWSGGRGREGEGGGRDGPSDLCWEEREVDQRSKERPKLRTNDLGELPWFERRLARDEFECRDDALDDLVPGIAPVCEALKDPRDQRLDRGSHARGERGLFCRGFFESHDGRLVFGGQLVRFGGGGQRREG